MKLLAAAPWYLATDADDAGDRSASVGGRPERSESGPRSGKDWTEAAQAGVRPAPMVDRPPRGNRGPRAGHARMNLPPIPTPSKNVPPSWNSRGA